MQYLEELFPDERSFEYEYHVGDGLRLDIYMPKYKVGIEYHGTQHFKFSSHFHGNMSGYIKAVARDYAKIQRCEDLGIALVVFTHEDRLTKDLVYDRMLDALNREVEETEVPLSYEEQQRERARNYRRERYREYKQRK